MNRNIIKQIVDVATELDKRGFHRESDSLSKVMIRVAQFSQPDTGVSGLPGMTALDPTNNAAGLGMNPTEQYMQPENYGTGTDITWYPPQRKPGENPSDFYKRYTDWELKTQSDPRYTQFKNQQNAQSVNYNTQKYRLMSQSVNEQIQKYKAMGEPIPQDLLQMAQAYSSQYQDFANPGMNDPNNVQSPYGASSPTGTDFMNQNYYPNNTSGGGQATPTNGSPPGYTPQSGYQQQPYNYQQPSPGYGNPQYAVPSDYIQSADENQNASNALQRAGQPVPYGLPQPQNESGSNTTPPAINLAV